MKAITIVFLLGLMQAFVVSAQQTSSTSVQPSNPTVCGVISRETGRPVFDAKFVYECLTSVPFNPAVGSRLVKYVNDTLQFHSTLAYLANPPPSYQQPAVDLVAELLELQDDIDSGLFENEYDFESTLQALLQAGHDDHLAMVGGILAPFAFGSPYAIASVSLDGKALPKIYITDDLFYNETDIAWVPSAVTTINGQDVVEFLTHFAAINSPGKLEPHADWNMLMQSGALDSKGYYEIFYGGSTFYPGETITIGFENGSSTGPETWDGLYYSPGDTGPLETGGDFYNFFMLGWYPASYVYNNNTNEVGADPPDDPPCPTPSPGELLGAYPAAADVVPDGLCSTHQGSVRGYFLNESSVAVLTIPGFLSYGAAGRTFSDTVRDFLRRSRSVGLRKVVIDLQQNSGGQAFLAFDTFKTFFPPVEPFAASRRRASPMADVLGSAFTSFWLNLDEDEDLYYALMTNEWVAANRLDAETGHAYESWEEYFGPVDFYNDDAFTNLERYNLSDHLFSEEAAGINIDDHSDAPTQYNAEDIIILTDGLCSSACALFMEMMHQVGVRTVVTGGRPSYGPMQGAGGTRGAAVYTAQQLDADIEGVVYIYNASTPGEVALPDRTLDLSLSYLSVNLRDQIREHDPDNIPLQFQYQPADCRIFYTPRSWYNYTALWLHAADAIWTDPGLCVANSTSEKNSLSPPPPQQRELYPPTTTPTVHPASNTTTEDNPANDIHAASPKLSSYDFRRCTSPRDCQGGGHYSCQMISVCHNGNMIKDGRCVAACSSISTFCGRSQCIIPLGSTGGRGRSASTARSAARDDFNTGHCLPQAAGWCLPAESYGSYPRNHEREKDRAVTALAKQGYRECDFYAGFSSCKNAQGAQVLVDVRGGSYKPYIELGLRVV